MKTLNKECQSTMGKVVLFQNNKYSIESYFNSNTNDLSVVLVIDKFYTDYPIMYNHSLNVAYDYPEKIPPYIKKKIKKILACYMNTKF